jgi:UPF0755 protein
MDFLKRYISRAAPFVFAGFLFFGYLLAFAPPPAFPADSIVIIARGASVPEIVQQLSDEHLVAHPSLLRFVLRIAGAGGAVQAGAYRFNSPQSLLTVAYRLITGAYGIPPARIFLPEGTTVREIAQEVADALPEISAADFTAAAKQYEGYLFPDTYLFQTGASADSVVAAMRENFNTKITALSAEISASGHSLTDIVIMASLVEKEARTVPNKKIVAGILWRRLELGMPLQVDAVFGYIFNKDTYSPSYADLKVDSPYNTYTHKGLPPTPIDNPGLDSLEAAISPTKTNYLYYLTGRDNLMHYATTYQAHLANQKKYLQ